MTENLQDLLAQAGSNAESSDDWTQPAAEPETPNEEAVQDEVVPEPQEHATPLAPARPLSPPRKSVESTSVDTASAIIRVVDALRSLEKVEHDVAVHLIGQGKELTAEPEIVLAVMESPSALVKTVRALLTARDHDPVERAFYIVKLEKSSARNLAGLVSSFRDEMKQPSDHVELARVLVAEIDEMTEDDITNIKATASLFDALEGGSDSE